MSGKAPVRWLIAAMLASSGFPLAAHSQERAQGPVVVLSGAVGSRWFLDYLDVGQSVAAALSIGVRPSSEKYSVLLEGAFASAIGSSPSKLNVVSMQIEPTLPFSKRFFVGAGAGVAFSGKYRGFTPVLSSGYRIPINSSTEMSPKVTYWRPSFQDSDPSSEVILSVQGSVFFR